jgi:phospholipid/cholesterol/gamma-HCH transport system permease protein
MDALWDLQPLMRTADGTGSVLEAKGAWTARHAAAIDARIADLSASPPHGPVVINMAAVHDFDTYGAVLLARLTRALEQGGRVVSVAGLPNRFSTLAAVVKKASEGPASTPAQTSLLADLQTRLERAVATIRQNTLSLLNMLGAIGLALVDAAKHPTRFRFTSMVHHLDRAAWQAVPIILLMTFLIGGIIAQQGFFHFRKFGADQYVVDMVGILVLREIGVLIVAIMVAGRSGSSYTAELGSMTMREEIDALRTMGHDPVAVLILPRIVALLIGLPALTFLGILAALYGGGLIAWLYGDMNPGIFIARLRDALSITHFKVGMIKAPFMALVIGVVACSEGLAVRGSAESLGLKTTASVVKSIFLVIVLDGMFAIYFAAIGM